MITKVPNTSFRTSFNSPYQHNGSRKLTEAPTFSGRQSLTLLHEGSLPVDVLGSSDIFYGTLIALVLAFTASFLQGTRNRDDFAPSELSDENTTSSTIAIDDGDSFSNDNIIFDADSWKDMSRPESYVFYNQKLKQRESKSPTFKSENALVLIALLALFVPIFSVEFFFALSRQLICGSDPMNQSDLSVFLCSPVMPGSE
mmetsp:Transcript_834/g.2091  ORF Transcript_834/g.2091 Transcript_834/m.2091 type:complete len:200 (-) Transcript_834:910-1509(-)|eukprot:CAMPEP_0172371896 /NCGR_PEP_ID=MMETSP1060-20121228/45346_1 /TAXON_ID=37318 /ORGANISM="Pseudo-nitzschia pungens, Strain cf. cingulata" /LENGTH=199 /DNA_ID=CAMNT_0013097671 /DNA_START=364 /DNA_END=963 /DNA_ORIENTATION=+